MPWVRLNTDIFDGQDFYLLGIDGVLMLIFLLATAGKENSSKFKLNIKYASSKLDISCDDLLSRINKLKENQILHVSVTNPYGSVHYGRTDGTNETNGTDGEAPSDQSKEVEETGSLNVEQHWYRKFITDVLNSWDTAEDMILLKVDKVFKEKDFVEWFLNLEQRMDYKKIENIYARKSYIKSSIKKEVSRRIAELK